MIAPIATICSETDDASIAHEFAPKTR